MMSDALLSFPQFKAKYSGKFVEYHSFDPRAKNQCTDLVNQYLVESWGVPAIIGTNAVDFPSKIKYPLEIVKETPDTVPQVGWVVVFKQYGSLYGSPGHIGIVDEKTDLNNLYVFEQNYPTGSFCKTNRHNYRGVVCYIRKVPTTQEPMPDTALQECLKQHTQLVTEIEAEKRKNTSLIEETKQKDLEIDRLRGELAEKSSVIKTLKEEMAQFMEALATKLTSIVDKSAIIGAVDRLISGESEYIKKVQKLEKSYALLEDEKKLEIEALKRSIDELRAENERQSKHIGMLETRLDNLEAGEVKQKSLFEIIKDLLLNMKGKS